MHQQQDKNYFHPPVSPIPPIQNYASNIICRYCNQPITIRYERISDADKGRPRYRNVPRSQDGNIHACKFTKETKAQEIIE